MRITKQKFRIKKENFVKAYHAVCELSEHNEKHSDLVEVLRMIGFIIHTDDSGICGLSFDGDTENYKVFFEALAPYVENDSYIVLENDHDNNVYTWGFNGGKMKIRLIEKYYKQKVL